MTCLLALQRGLYYAQIGAQGQIKKRQDLSVPTDAQWERVMITANALVLITITMILGSYVIFPIVPTRRLSRRSDSQWLSEFRVHLLTTMLYCVPGKGNLADVVIDRP